MIINKRGLLLFNHQSSKKLHLQFDNNTLIFSKKPEKNFLDYDCCLTIMENISLYSLEFGRGKEQTILFLHAGGLSGQSWLPVMQRLPEFHCLAPDLPGQGRSRDIPFSIQASVDACARLIRERVPGQKVHLAALSLGGPVAFSLLREYPDLIDSVLISGCSGQIPAWQTGLAKASLWTYRLFKPQTLVDMTLKQQGIPAQYRELVADDLARATAEAFMRPMLDELSRWQLPESLSQPLLLVVGEGEPRAARRFTRGYLQKFPAARGLLAPKMRHAWSLEQPDLFAALLRAWVSGKPLPEGFQPFV
jgi:pimeloyl-ACP methyl ester carboxylesterase